MGEAAGALGGSTTEPAVTRLPGGEIEVKPPTSFPAHPTPFLEVRVHEIKPHPGVTGLCAGYEQRAWREKQLALHLMKWLPEFALKHTELEGLGAQNAVELIARAAKSVYASEKYKNRGEFGELLLHVGLRQCFKTLPAITKYFYKDSRNDTVKGFDAVHVVAADGGLELWLGEVKFYDDVARGIAHVITEIEEHLQRDYLRDEFAAITNKIDDTWAHAEKLKRLLHPDTSLDEVFDCVCIPVLLTYDSPVIQAFSEVSAEYKTRFEAEIRKHHAAFSDKLKQKTLPERLRIHLFLLTLREKASLVAALDEALKRMQEIQ